VLVGRRSLSLDSLKKRGGQIVVLVLWGRDLRRLFLTDWQNRLFRKEYMFRR
jgi:hypothetical protein